jgi:hypothetical protein
MADTTRAVPRARMRATIPAMSTIVGSTGPFVGESGPVVGATMIPMIAPIINAALGFTSTPAPAGAPAQVAAPAIQTSAMIAGGLGQTCSPYAASIAALATKTPNDSGFFPSLGAKAVRTG